MPRSLPLFACGLIASIALAGCAAPDMQKSVSERTTTPIAQIELKKPGAFEPAFEKSRLRTLDPCATLRSAELSRLGEPAKDTPADLGACSNFMQDHQGRDLHVTLYLEASLYDATKHRLAGLPAQIDGTGPTCYARVESHEGETSRTVNMRGVLDDVQVPQGHGFP